MKDLLLNPTNHDIVASVDEIDQEAGLATVNLWLSTEEGTTGVLTATELKKIGEWFLKLSKELSK